MMLHTRGGRGGTAGLDAGADRRLYEDTPDACMLLVDFRYGEPTGTDLLGEGLQEVLLGEATPAQVAERLQSGVEQWFEPDAGMPRSEG